ncbi:putative F-box domain protein, partial [Trichinella spiralis]
MDHLAVSCPHVIQKICSYLDVGDIISFAKTCKSVNKIVDDEKMWIMLNFR